MYWVLNTFKGILKWFFSYGLTTAIACIPLDGKEWKYSKFFEYLAVNVERFTDQDQISKTIGVDMLKHCIFLGVLMVCKIGFTNWNEKISLFRASMVVTYYIKLFRTGTDLHDGILVFLLLAEEIKKTSDHSVNYLGMLHDEHVKWTKQVTLVKIN